MSDIRRDPASAGEGMHLRDTPYLAKVVSHLDPEFMGRIEVTLLNVQGQPVGSGNNSYYVRYASPFAGSTAFEHMGDNVGDYNDTQKSYGMFMMPPDVGVTCIVIFVGGNRANGFVIGFVTPSYANNMIPGIASSSFFDDLTDEQKEKYGTFVKAFPTAEPNRRIYDLSKSTNIDQVKRPIHPFADVLLQQGLLQDDVRGITTSSARRDIPPMVFGISTPGPLDKRPGSKRAVIGRQESNSPTPVAVSRLGGTQLVFDDGDHQFQRITSAATGPVQYRDLLDPEDTRTSQPTIPYNEHVRLRTRTGHQILMHNSEDLIYIANARGTAWIEMSSNGKIDIFAEDSVSIHTKNDFNFLADRDVNIEARRNFNVKAAGRFNGDFGNQFHLRSGLDGKMTFAQSLDVKVGTDTIFNTGAKLDIGSGDAMKLTSGAGGMDIFSTDPLKITSGATVDLLAQSGIKATGASFDIGATGAIVIKGATVDINGPDAAPAEAAGTAGTATEAPPLSIHQVPVTVPANWTTTQYQAGTLSTIMLRVPMHEPWTLHENQAPQQLTPSFTDRDNGGSLAPEYVPATQQSAITDTAAHVGEVNNYESTAPDPTTVRVQEPGATPTPPASSSTTAVPQPVPEGTPLPEDYFRPSSYSRVTAQRLNTLHPDVRRVFAACFKAFVDTYHSQGYDIQASEAIRSFERSQQLYEAYRAGTGPQAAPAGASWHNYGAAVDIIIYVNGVWDRNNSSGAYTGIARDIFRQNGAHNNAGANDTGHFVPLQMTARVPNEVRRGDVTIAQLMSGAVTIS